MKRVNGISAKKSGFTLLELLIVMAILIVVIGMLGTTVWGQYRKALIRTATVQVQSKLTDALELFFVDFKRYPYPEEGLYILADMDNPDAKNIQQQQQQQQNQQQSGMGMQTGMGMDASGMGMQTGMGMDASGMGMQTGMGMDANGMGMQTGMGGANGMQQGMNPQQQQAYHRPKIVEPYIKEQDLKDPWGQQYRYEYPTTKGDGKKPAVWSCGPDKEDNNGEGDDIINWDSNDTSGQMRMQQQQQQQQMQSGMGGMQPGVGMDGTGMGGMQPGMGMDGTGMGGMQPGMGMDGTGMGGMQTGMGMDGTGMGGMQTGMGNQPGMGGMQPGMGNQPGMGGMQPGMGNQPGMGGMQPGMGNQPGMGGMQPGMGGGTNMNGGMTNPGGMGAM